MSTPEIEALRKAVATFNTALERVDKLNAAYRRQRTILIVMGGLIAVLIALGVLMGVFVRSVQQNGERDSRRAVISSLQNCQGGNDANNNLRGWVESFYASLDETIGKTPQGHDFVVGLKADNEAKHPIVDRDCDDNGVVGNPGDYGSTG